MATKKGAFKSKGKEILKPNSMSALLSGKPEPEMTAEPDVPVDVPKLDVEMHKTTGTQLHKPKPTTETERFHLQIRVDLADLVHDEIRRRKRKRMGRRASQRAIVEEALEGMLK